MAADNWPPPIGATVHLTAYCHGQHIGSTAFTWDGSNHRFSLDGGCGKPDCTPTVQASWWESLAPAFRRSPR